MDYFTLRPQLIENGFIPLPIAPNDKYPSISKWTATDYTPPTGFKGHGVGILTGKGEFPICGIDIDILIPEIAEQVQNFAMRLCGETVYRIGKAPKSMLLYQAQSAGIRKQYSRHFENLGHVEFWGLGQQLVAFGTHPDTKKPYYWPGLLGDILDVKAKDLPVIDLEQMQEIITFTENLAEKLGYQPKTKEQKAELVSVDYDPADPLDFKEPLNIGQEKCKELIAELDPDSSRDEWLKIGMALHHEFSGSDEGLALWDDWSRKGAKYNDGEPERLWESFGRYSGPPVTAATILKLTKKEEPIDQNFFKSLEWSTNRFLPNPPEVPMVIEGFLPKGIVSLFYSAGGAGKSTIILNMAVKIALANVFSTDFLGHYVHGGNVVILTAEDPELILNRRFIGCINSIADELCEDSESVRRIVTKHVSIVSTYGKVIQLFKLKADGTLLRSQYFDSFLDALQDIKNLNLLVIDTKTRFSPGEGAGNVTATQEITHYETLATVTGASVMLLHHSNKSSRDGSQSGAQAYRDATALFDSVRAAWYLRGLTEAELLAQDVSADDKNSYLLLENSKNNYIPQDKDKVLKRIGYRYEISKLKPKISNADKKEMKKQQAYDMVLDIMQTNTGGSYNQSSIVSICASAGLSRGRVLEALGAAEEDGLIYKTDIGITKQYNLTEEGKLYKLTVEEVA